MMAFLQLAIFVTFAFICSKCIYNLYIHPLRHYPGPLLDRATVLPQVWRRLRGTIVSHSLQTHAKYGPIVRMSPSEISYTTSEAWNDIFMKQDGHAAAFPKSSAVTTSPKGLPPNIALVKDGPDSQRLRRLFAPAFTNTALKKQETLILNHVRKLVAVMRRACASGSGNDGEKDGRRSAVVNISDLFNFLTFDVMADLAFGAPLDLLDTTTYTPWVRSIIDAFKVLNLWVVLGLYLPRARPVLASLAFKCSKRIVERRQAALDYATALAEKRLARSEEWAASHPDVWTFVERNPDVLSRQEMRMNAAAFMSAGTETTATSLCGIVWWLAQHPEKMEKLRAEIRAHESVESFTMETLLRLPYLNAVINESMRLYSAIPDVIARAVPKGGAVVCGDHLPAGTTVGIHMTASFRSSRNFHRPMEFIPERWLDGPDSKEFANDDRNIFHPFGMGARNCIGKNLALHEIRLTLAYVLWHFDLTLAPGSSGWMQQKSFLVWERPPLMVQLREAT